jgi:hypothetical protein
MSKGYIQEVNVPKFNVHFEGKVYTFVTKQSAEYFLKEAEGEKDISCFSGYTEEEYSL